MDELLTPRGLFLLEIIQGRNCVKRILVLDENEPILPHFWRRNRYFRHLLRTDSRREIYSMYISILSVPAVSLF